MSDILHVIEEEGISKSFARRLSCLIDNGATELVVRQLKPLVTDVVELAAIDCERVLPVSARSTTGSGTRGVR